jgi:tetratricopeptide (TPR) repeat protein
LILAHGGGASVTEAETVLEGLRRILGPLHSQTQAAAKMLAATRQMAGDLDGAERGYRAVAETVEAVYGPDHPQAIEGRLDLARIALRRGDPQEAFRTAQELGLRARRAYAAGSGPLANTLSALGGFAIEAERWPDAEAAFGEALTIYTELGTDRSVLGVRCRVGLASAAIAQGDAEGAERWARAALALPEPLAQAAWARSRATLVLGQALLKRSAFAQAEAELLEAHRLASMQTGPSEDATRLAAVRSLVELYERWAAAEPAKDTSEPLARWRERQR